MSDALIEVTVTHVDCCMFIVYCMFTERPKSKDGESVVYRLKDWPSGEEFMALMPSRYLMKTSETSLHTLCVTLLHLLKRQR